MRLEKIDKNKKKRICSFLFVVVTIIGIVLFSSYALYKEKNNIDLNEEKLDFASENVELAFTINGEKSSEEFPVKSSGYEVSNVTCKNGVTASWNQEKWGLSNIESNGSAKIQCSIDFSIPKVLLVNYLKNLNSSELVDDETTDHNLRYIGKNPNNYVSFNGELWRIIGLMNDVADESGVVEPRVKLIRNDSIGNYAWDNKPSGTGSSTSDYGSNNWNDSAIKEVLNNGAYYNRTSGNCPSGREDLLPSHGTVVCDFSNSGLTNESKNMISKVKWKLGGTSNYTTNSNGLASHWYGYERGNEVYSGRPTEWMGKVGLIYPSDYGYATSGGSTANRKICLESTIANWSRNRVCIENDWISSSTEWTITHKTISGDYAYSISGGYMADIDVNVSSSFHPVVYLNTNLNIKSGTGTSTDPFVLET